MTYVFHSIPRTKPDTPLLEGISLPSDMRTLEPDRLPELAKELREYLLYCVGQSGGHFGAGLGVVELTIALHYLCDTPNDKIVWDVGHQAYPHKILTGRREEMTNIRQQGGLTAFPRRSESPYDTFGVGHSSTSISAALGMALAAKNQGRKQRSVAVIGDGAMTAGIAFEALNHAAHTKANLLVILNDNDMSISRNVGGLSNYLAKVLSSKTYQHMREGGKKVLSGIPSAFELARRTEEHVKGMVAPGTLFEELGFNYIGPIDGHDLSALIPTLQNMLELDGTQFLHIVTQKGKGFSPAEADPVGYHAINKLEPQPKVTLAPSSSSLKGRKKPSYSNVFGDWVCDMAEMDERLVAITPAMEEGSDLIRFAEKYPKRYYDVAIAEQHALTLAAGLACEGEKPIVAIYSTFLQRGYDQLIHDIAIQNLDVLFAIDRAGLVGQDGPTHAGSFDLTFLRCVPNLTVMAPADENEARQMLYTGFQIEGPTAVRYPRGTGPGVNISKTMTALPVGKGEYRRKGDKIALLSFGALLTPAHKAADNLGATLVNMRFIKPLDEQLILELAATHDLLVTVEENTVLGGAGSGVSEVLSRHGICIPILHLGLPDRFVEHAKPEEMLKECGLDTAGIEDSIRQYSENLFLNSQNSLHQRQASEALSD